MRTNVVVIGLAAMLLGIYLAVATTPYPVLEPVFAWGGFLVVLVGATWPPRPTA